MVEETTNLELRMQIIIEHVAKEEEVWYTNLCNSFGSYFSRSGQAYRQALWACIDEKSLVIGTDRKVRVNKGR